MHARTVIVGLFGATVVVALLLSLSLAADLGGGGAVAQGPPPLPEEEDEDLPPLPDVTPTPVVVESQLTGCAGNYHSVYGFDNVTKTFSRFFPGQPAISTLTEMQAGAGYMILLSADCTLVNGTTTWSLSAGWNFIGWR
jgi:hypothetical protein